MMTVPIPPPADPALSIARSVTAELAAGWLHISLLHGDPETHEELARLATIRRVLDDPDLTTAAGPTLVATRGGNDWTTWCLRGPLAAITQLAVLGILEQIAPSWWRWSTEPTPPTGLASGSRRVTGHPKARATGECVGGCGLAAAPGDVFCPGCRDGHERDRVLDGPSS